MTSCLAFVLSWSIHYSFKSISYEVMK